MEPDTLPVEALRWRGGALELLDQERLPDEERWLRIRDVAALVLAMRRLAVRGAPLLGCAGAYGCVTAVQDSPDSATWLADLESGAAEIAAARPTAINLSHGTSRMLDAGRRIVADTRDPAAATDALLEEARAYHTEDRALCAAIGEHGLGLLEDGARVLTHCNAGALATGGLGTALAPLHLAAARGMRIAVFADETRPLRQGARLTAWELSRSGIPTSVICDGAAASLLASGGVDLVLVGADRIAANGDVANKIGTYPLALAAREHGVLFAVAAPSTSYDAECPDGASIPIEQRADDEILGGRQIDGVEAWNPAFDITPAALVGAWITEHGVHRDSAALRRALGQAD